VRVELNFINFLQKEEKIAVVGMGYVGLPLALLLANKFSVIGFDIQEKRIEDLVKGIDCNGETPSAELLNSGVEFFSTPESLKKCKIIIVCVPTPIDEHKAPNLKPLLSASKAVGENLSSGSIVVYESTVYPGVTEEHCVQVLEEESNLKWKKDFNVGYSPERVNPGDKNHTIDKIIKVVSGDTPQVTALLEKVYGEVITAGIHTTPNIKTAEAAKVIENTQRDLNIALINELATIFHQLDINTLDVLEAAGTKWNFLKFTPGLVGGHCIGVDPYYLTFKARMHKIEPEVILAGRSTNDRMGKYVAEQTIKKLIQEGKVVKDSKVLILGFTFKENISDFRNTKVKDICDELIEYQSRPIVFDPYVDREEFEKQFPYPLIQDQNELKKFSAIVFAVNHKKLCDYFSLDKCIELQEENPILMDIKGVFRGSEELKEKAISYFQL
jgi:UDP-N-acetyl-D-glucosamine/UDP-N-acetyl-D-galactosamine dehydrogenase